MTVVSNGQFWIYTMVIFIVWIIVITTAFNNDSNMKNKVSLANSSNEDDLKNTGNCKSLCKHCGCLGFYCGEECICECNNDHTDTECIGLIQLNAKKLNIPFEVLIQGPTANTFVRNAFQFEQNIERRSFGYRNKRSTVTVYKPNKDRHEASTKEKKTLLKEIFNLAKTVKDRRKRSNDQFIWFNDFGSNLLRPAPLGGFKRKAEESKTPPSVPKSSTVSSTFDNSWFLHNTPNIFTPAPLIKRKNYKQSTSDIANENNEDSSLEKTEKFALADDNHEMETIYSDEVKVSQIDNKDPFLPEEKRAKASEDYPTSRLYPSSFKDNKVSIIPDDKKADETQDTSTSSLFVSEEKPAKIESLETLRSGLYSRLFKDDLSKSEDTNFFVSQEKELEDELFKDDFSEINDKNEEIKPDKVQKSVTGSLYSRLFKDDLSSSDISLPTKVKKGLKDFRIPWFKPRNFLEKVKRLIET